MASSMKKSEEKIEFGPWSIIARNGPIATSEKSEHIIEELDIPAIPEMVFVNTTLDIVHESSKKISFNAIDALRLVDNKNDLIKVSYANEWQQQRADSSELVKGVVKPFDWTFTTSYKGTISKENPFQEIETKDRIDLERLKQREQIKFYQDLILYEDELGDNGTVILNVKIRVMPTSFFLLQRFFLRVDDVLIRVNETRMYHEAGKDFILREYTSREDQIDNIKNPLADINILANELPLIEEKYHKLVI